jgi:hypothetical protein
MTTQITAIDDEIRFSLPSTAQSINGSRASTSFPGSKLPDRS